MPRSEKMNKPLISIIVCTYNRASMLKEAMRHILCQSYEPVEILVIDDGSTGSTEEVISEYKGSISYYRQENKGIATARTVACEKLAKGEYIAFQDDDDIMPPHRITCLYEAMRLHPRAVLATGDWELIDVDGRQTGRRVAFDVKGKNGEPLLIEDGYKAVMWPLVTPIPSTTIFRRTDGHRIGWFDARFSRSSDTDFFARLGKLGPVLYVPQIVDYYRTGHPHLWSDDILSSLHCEYSNVQLYEKHLNSIEHTQREMRTRLQERLLNSLKRIAFLVQFDKKQALISRDYVKRGLSLLGIKDRLLYALYNNMKLPLRNALKPELN